MIKNYSIVTTVYNDEKEVIILLKELEKQTYRPAEVIIVDGGSKDNTVEVIKRYSKSSLLDIRVEFGERLNIAQGLNRGIQNAHYEFIGIAMCGNHYRSNFFQQLYEDFEKEDDIYVTYGAIRWTSTYEWGKKCIEFAFGQSNSIYLEKFPTNHGNLARKELYDKAGFFYEQFQYAGEDTEFFVRIKNQGYNVYGDNDAVIDWDIPADMKQLCKQQMGYTIADMEMFNNITLFEIYWRKGCYVFMWVFWIACLLLPKIRLLGLIICMWLIYKNVCKWRMHGIQGCMLLNLTNFVPILTIIKNCKFLLKKNKIPMPLKNYY